MTTVLITCGALTVVACGALVALWWQTMAARRAINDDEAYTTAMTRARGLLDVASVLVLIEVVLAAVVRIVE